MSQVIFSPYMECSLDLAIGLVNSAHQEHDHLADIHGLESFLKEHRVSDLKRPSRKDLEDIHALRAQLGRVWQVGDPGQAARILNKLLAESGANPVLTDHDGPWHLHYSPPGSGLAARLAAETAMALAVVVAEDGYGRFRVCDSETCPDVFVDVSRNKSRKYCSPSICGNRASVRAYRERQKTS